MSLYECGSTYIHSSMGLTLQTCRITCSSSKGRPRLVNQPPRPLLSWRLVICSSFANVSQAEDITFHTSPQFRVCLYWQMYRLYRHFSGSFDLVVESVESVESHDQAQKLVDVKIWPFGPRFGRFDLHRNQKIKIRLGKKSERIADCFYFLVTIRARNSNFEFGGHQFLTNAGFF